ncbi:MAG: right-handed parallel beta-helix repeat-containing protein [Bacteroidia bacterium]
MIDGFIVNDMPRNGIRVVLSDFVIIRNNQCDHNFERGIFTGFTDHILIENNICTNSIDEHGIYFSNSGDFPIIRNNVCHHNRGAGIQINADLSAGGDGITTGAVIEGNILYENGTGGGAAINLDGAVESLVANNLLYNNHATGIALFRQDAAIGARDNKIYNNTVIQAPDARWCININTGSTGATLHNNILITFHSFRGSIAVDNSSIQGFSSDYNIVVDRLTSRGDDFSDPFSSWQQDGYGLHSMLADPMADIFDDSGSLDFHLMLNSSGHKYRQRPDNRGNNQRPRFCFPSTGKWF